MQTVAWIRRLSVLQFAKSEVCPKAWMTVGTRVINAQWH